MQDITKEDILEAFSKRRRGKFNLLYLHYKVQYFHQGLPAEVIAQKISKDLGLTITAANIYEINRRHTSSVSALSELKQEIKQEILQSLQLDQKNTQGALADKNSSVDPASTTHVQSPTVNQSLIIDPSLSMDEFEIFLREKNLSIDQLQKALKQETDIAKQIFIKQKIKQVEFLDSYHNNTPKKSIFD